MHSNTRFCIAAGTTVKLLPYGQYPGYKGGVRGGQKSSWLMLEQGGHDFDSAVRACSMARANPGGTPGSVNPAGRAEVYLRNASRVFIHDWNSTNPPMKHIVMDGHNFDITVRNTTNCSPDMSPSQNTDCLNLLGTRCLVQDCTFMGCDDNIAIGRSAGACVDVLITNVTCGTGHGISFGSVLPSGGISNVTVINCTFSGTQNGIRFKSDNDKAHGGAVQNVRFFNIGMTNVRRPIIIYSYYNRYGAPDNITPAIVASTDAEAVTANTPVWRDILISNVWGTASSGSKRAGIIWGRPEILVSNVTLQNINLSVPATFNVYNARGVRFVDCEFKPSSGRFPTYTIHNADLTITNSSRSPRPVTFDGLTATTNQISNVLSLYNAQAGLTNTSVLGNQPRLTLGGSRLQVTNDLTLTASSVLTFLLGTNATMIGVTGNLAVAGTINVADGGGLTNAAYLLFTNGGTLAWNSPKLGTTPPGSTCKLDIGTPGQVKLVVTFPARSGR